jgi:hypothetical protein
VNDHDEFVIFAWLEEGMLHIRESYVNDMTFLRCKPDSILVDLQVAEGLLAHYVWSDNQVLQDFLLALHHDQFFKFLLIGSASFLVSCIFLFQDFDMLDQVLDLLSACVQVIIAILVSSVLQSKFLYEDGVLVSHGWELQH